ncbi:Hypothetical predicted protein [Podarcis lilfordi]|uniref:Uncharacterized protein n=1 Tax=Podarcis lilfordi TaxID=74358 RepID=A0AA35JVI9_9SAUR|nr:Hypothetical predicted protein [Podarcis lilfordi]
MQVEHHSHASGFNPLQMFGRISSPHCLSAKEQAPQLGSGISLFVGFRMIPGSIREFWGRRHPVMEQNLASMSSWAFSQCCDIIAGLTSSFPALLCSIEFPGEPPCHKAGSKDRKLGNKILPSQER